MITVNIRHDSDVENPLEHTGWTLHSFSTKHRNYKHPHEVGLGPMNSAGEPAIMFGRLRRKLQDGRAFVCSYFEHGNCMWFLKGQCPPGVEFRWDGVRVAGLIVFEGGKEHWIPREYEERAKHVSDMLADYTAWCNGEGYWFEVLDEDGDYVDSCSGYLGDGGVDQMVEDILRAIDGDEFVVEEDAAGVRDRIIREARVMKSRASKEVQK